MSNKTRVLFVSVVPSPYQRDLFAALHDRQELSIAVRYLEASSPDSPWPEKPLAEYERVLPGFWFSAGAARCHLNWKLPPVAGFDVVVLNTLMSLTAQRLMRISLRRKPWLFWGERLANRGGWHEALAAPLHRASGIVGIGTLATQDYARRYPEPKHFNIPYCCAVDPFLRSERERHEGTVFLFCGQMIRRKGVDILLEAFSRLRGNARLLLVGREAELPGLLAPLPAAVRERIEYAGFQAPEALPRFFARADVFVLPSRYDGWGVVVNQAIAAGLPLVCSDTVGAAYDLLDPWVNGLRIPPGDPGLLAEAMQHFVDVPGLAPAWGLASRIQAHRFTPQAGASRWVDVLSELTQAG